MNTMSSLSRLASVRHVMRRSMSSMNRYEPRGRGMSPTEPVFPIYGDDCVMKLKLSTFSRDQGQGQMPPRPGGTAPKILLEFMKKVDAKQYDWQNAKRIMLTLEELGLLLDFKDDPSVSEEIIFTRGGEEGVQATSRTGQTYVQKAAKTITFASHEGGGWLVSCDEGSESLSVHVTRGRRVIFQELIRHTLPSMLGWTAGSGASSSGQSSVPSDRSPF